MEKILKILKDILPLQEDELELFLSKFDFIHLKKGDYFIRQGDTKSKLGLIVKGVMYCYYNKEGEQIIDEFSLDYDFITDYASYLLQQPAEKNVVCIEDTQLLVVSFEKLDSEFVDQPNFEKMRRIITEQLFLNWHQKAKSLMLDKAEQRYLKLISKRSDLVQRVPQYLIASYLNITPETLSRIRRKLATKRFS